MKTGVLIRHFDENVAENFANAAKLGFTSCQVAIWDMQKYSDAMAEKLTEASRKYNVEISSLWCGWSGPAEWNFYGGPKTLGLVPEEYRQTRVHELKLGSDFAAKIGVKNIITHMGFLPENPNDKAFSDVVIAIRDVAEHCKKNGQRLLFETGQETPVTLLRTFDEVGLDNLGINLDPANLLMYGKANPVDALDVFGKYVFDVHAKDGCYPTDGKNLGCEMPVGSGRVNFPALVAKLFEIGYNGPLTIEREISGDEQIRDIIAAKAMLDKLIAEHEE